MSSLYLDHFRLSEAPFGITPNGKFFFEGQARGAILEALHHAVLDDDGIITVVGEVGSGKTMLCRMLADRLPRDQVDLVYLANPSFGPREILHSMVADWGLKVPAGQPLVLSIQAALLERHAQGRRAVVLIDEAHLIPRASNTMYRRFLDGLKRQNPLLKVIGFTATPYRLDSGRLHEGKDAIFTDIAFEVSVRELIDAGYLAPLVSKRM
ncbi:MAG: ExeA family protein, partial [Gammaproteobacteria bacterium]